MIALKTMARWIYSEIFSFFNCFPTIYQNNEKYHWIRKWKWHIFLELQNSYFQIPITPSPFCALHCKPDKDRFAVVLEYLQFGWIQNFPFPLLFLLVELDNNFLAIKIGQSSPQFKILALPQLFFGVIVLHFGCSLIWFDSEMAPTRASLRPLYLAAIGGTVTGQNNQYSFFHFLNSDKDFYAH